MKSLSRETAANFDVFTKSWQDQLSEVIDLGASPPRFLGSYRRLVSLQAWRVEVIEGCTSPDAFGFYLESQNDALLSHVLASLCTWRSSLKSLRSCIENFMFWLYYKDHPVELALWNAGKHRIGFREMEKYLREHPDMLGVSLGKTAVDQLAAEYSTLSKAVHASARGFRMADADTGVQLWVPDAARLGMWESRQKAVMSAVNLSLMVLYRNLLTGTSHLNLRKAISLSVSKANREQIDADLRIKLYAP